LSIIVIDNGEEYSAHELVFLDPGELTVEDVASMLPFVHARWGTKNPYIVAIADNIRWLYGGAMSVGEWTGCIFAPEKWPRDLLTKAVAISEDHVAKNPADVGIRLANEYAKKILTQKEA
jgi:hypothetical protein